MHQAEAFEHPDDVATEIDLPPADPIEGCSWERMVIVVPAFPETQYPHNPLVAAAIVRFELALAKGVADRIDTKGDMVSDKNPHQAPPQETCPAAKREWDRQRQRHPEQEGAINKDNDRILQQVAAVYLGISEAVFEEPANMRMKEAFHRAMGVALTVGVRMMLDMCGSKLDWGPFYSHGAKDKQDNLHYRVGPEAAMGQHAMVANRHAECGERVHRGQECQIGPVDGPLPKQSYCQNSSEEGNDHNHEGKRFGIRHRSHKTSANLVAS